MKRVGLILVFALLFLPCRVFGADTQKQVDRLVFVYHIPDDEQQVQEQDIEQIPDITSDDITADTSGIPTFDEDEDFDDEEYLISDMYTDVLKGYASYDEGDDESEAISLDPELSKLVLNIKNPVIIQSTKYTSLKTSDSLFDNIYTRFNGAEYSIEPVSNKHSDHIGYGLSTGTLYEQEISYGELEQSSGVFSKYEYKNFSLTTSYTKTVNTTNNNYNDKFAITPELRLNDYFTLKQKLSADTVKKRKKAEFILSVNPFGKRDSDRLKFDFTLGETYDEVSNTFWNRFEFNTTIKL